MSKIGNPSDYITLTGENATEKLRGDDIDIVQSRIEEQHPDISGLFKDKDLLKLKSEGFNKRFNFERRIIQILNTDYTWNGKHWLTIVKDPGKRFQIYDSDIRYFDRLGYLEDVLLYSVGQQLQNPLSVYRVSSSHGRYFDQVGPTECQDKSCRRKRIRVDENRVYMCSKCYLVFHEDCRPIYFMEQIWPLCKNCRQHENGNINQQPSLDMTNTSAYTCSPDETMTVDNKYLHQIANKYFTQGKILGSKIYFDKNFGTEDQQHPYVFVEDRRDASRMLLYDCSATHYPDYSLAHDTEVTLVHLSWPNLHFCEEIEILPARQQDPVSNDCGVYAGTYAISWAEGNKGYFLQQPSALDARKRLEDKINFGTPLILGHKIVVDLNCKATFCQCRAAPQATTVDMYKCLFCQGWFHNSCSSCHTIDTSETSNIYKMSCDSCFIIWSGIKQTLSSASQAQVEPESNGSDTGAEAARRKKDD